MDTETQAAQVADPVQADTSAPEAQSEASTQVNEAPEAASASQEADVNATDTVEDKLYAGKYKSVEDMEKAYTELQSKFGQTTSEKAELSRILNEAFTPTQQAQEAVDDYSESDPVNQEIETLKRTTAVQGFIMNHQDANPAEMQKILSEDPLVRQISGHEAKLEYAYLRSQNMGHSKAVAEAKKTAASATQAKIVEKQTAQVEAVKTSEQTDEKSELKGRMASGSYEEREKARREYIRKYLV